MPLTLQAINQYQDELENINNILQEFIKGQGTEVENILQYKESRKPIHEGRGVYIGLQNSINEKISSIVQEKINSLEEENISLSSDIVEKLKILFYNQIILERIINP